MVSVSNAIVIAGVLPVHLYFDGLCTESNGTVHDIRVVYHTLAGLLGQPSTPKPSRLSNEGVIGG